MWRSFSYLLAFVSSPYKLVPPRTSSKIAEMSEQSPHNLTIHRFRGLLHPFLYRRTPVNDGELRFLRLKVAQQEDRVASSRGKSCSAYGPPHHLKRRSLSPGSSAAEVKATEIENSVTRVATVAESCPSMDRSSSRQRRRYSL